ncbi:hypothetical protein ES705_47959 [subsurface metagenome]
MKDCNLAKEFIDNVFFLVRHHETGGDSRTDVLRNADSISFFHINLPYYFARNNIEDVKRRFLWGYRKLPDSLRKILIDFGYRDKQLASLVKDWAAHS